MQHINYLAFAIPAFFLFVYLEFIIAKRLKKPEIFNYESSVSNLSIGIAERLLNLFIAGSFYSIFTWVYENYALLNIPNVWWVWVLAILATDLVWYWYHRLGHEINILWAAHIVHHQSDEFNLTVSARITTFQALIRSAFWCVLPLLGFHPNLVITILTIHGAYSFFTHTQIIPRTKWLEYVLITPSLHGVHHASDEKYLDKNYGDVFVFWDKLFGTFQPEEEQPKYGLTHPLKSRSFLWQHFHYYLELLESAKQQTSIRKKLMVFFANPATLDQNIRPNLEKRFFQHRSNTNLKFKFKKYINFQIVLSVVALILTTAFFAELTFYTKMFSLFLVILTLINCGALLEKKKYVYYLECFRLMLTFIFAFYQFDILEYIFLPTIILIAVERIFALRQVYETYVLQYERVKN